MNGFAAAWAKTKLIASVVRLTPFDTSAEEGRSKERYRRVALTAASAVVAKGVTLLTTLVSVPLTLNYLGTERYGLWMTISSAIALLGFADLGMGNGLLNALSEAHGKDDRDLARRSVSSGFFVLMGIAVLVAGSFALSYPHIPWPRVFNATSDLASRECGPALAVFVVCFALNIPLGVVQRVQMGYQEGFSSNLWQAGGSLLGLGSVLVAIYFQVGLPGLVLAMTGAPLVATLLNWFAQFGRARPWLFPRWRYFEWTTAQRIAGTGMVFLLLQVMTLVTSASDNLIIAQALGNSAVAGYAVVQKLFSVALLSQVFILPLWPAFGEAMARSDHAWAKRTLVRALLVGIGSTALVSLPLLLFGKSIIAIWVGPALAPSTMILAGFALWGLVGSYGGVMSTFFNSGPLVSRQIGFYAVTTVVALLLKIVLVSPWQAAGVVWATVIAFSLFYVAPAWQLARSALRQDK
jgi:O-antigen/teichoic acid export membrane protein